MKKGIKNKALVFSWFDGSFQCAVSLSTGLWQLSIPPQVRELRIFCRLYKLSTNLMGRFPHEIKYYFDFIPYLYSEN